MNPKRLFIAICLISAAFASSSCRNQHKLYIPEDLFCSALDSMETSYAPSLKKGETAPLFALPDSLGRIVKLDEYRGSIVVLDFWASWCPDCRREAPMVKEIFEKYGEGTVPGFPVKFLSISFDNDAEAWKRAIQEEGFVWPQLCNLIKWKENPVSADYGINWIPAFYVIDPEGKIISGCIKAGRIGEILESLNK